MKATLRKVIETIIIGVSLGAILFGVGVHQIDSMFWSCCPYDIMCQWLWIPELGLNYKNSFILFWSVAFAGMCVLITTIYRVCSLIFWSDADIVELIEDYITEEPQE